MSEYPNSEFIKVQRKAAQLAEDAYEEDQEWCPTKVLRLLDACNRIESLKQQRGDLLAAFEAQIKWEKWHGPSDTGRNLKQMALTLRDIAIAKCEA